MALSPWLGSTWLESRDAAALLAGIRPDEITMRSNESLSPDFDNWWQKIKLAIASGELLARKETMPSEKNSIPDGWPKTYDEWLATDLDNWSAEDCDACLGMILGASPIGVDLDSPFQAWIEKSDLRAWLLKLGITDKDIPEEIRTYTKGHGGLGGEDLHPKREATYQKIIATLLALQYGCREIEQPFPLADELLDDCKINNIRAPASRSTLGPLFDQLQSVQKANPD
ncbi:hypothetical protein R3F64_09435 [Halomonas sp. 5021]|uniref:hypothetical protein n=1 Tax=Halomonas sp. 5021 TaxID=3082156 RepID=UPI002FC98207